MSCPHLKEVVMLYCGGFPVKKMVPLDRIVSASPCLTQDFQQCALYREIVARLQANAGPLCADLGAPPASQREGQR